MRNHNRLGRFVPDSELLFERLGEFAILNNQNHAAGDVGMFCQESLYLVVGSGTARTLRAMLEKHNRFVLRSLEKWA